MEEIKSKELSQEQPKVRERKILRTSCQICKELGNLENMFYQKIGLKDQEGKELYGCFEGVYFCSENCKALFNLSN